MLLARIRITRPLAAFISAFALAILAAGVAGAQEYLGTVTDQDGRAVARAEVVATGDSGAHAVVATDNSGGFTFSMSARLLRIVVRAEGFADFEKRFEGKPPSPIPIVLRPAVLTDSVSVSIAGDSRLADSPASIAVLSRDGLASTPAQRIDDVLRQIPGFTLFRRSSGRNANPTTQGANLRGLAGSGASRVSVLYDGFSVNDAFGGWTYWSRVPTVAADQIEVLRGGASSFFGDQGLSGAVLIQPARFRGKPILKADLSAGTSRTFDGSLFAAAGRGRWTGDVAIGQFQTAGYIPADESVRGGVDTRAGSRFRNSQLRIERRIGEELTVFVRAAIFGERRDNGTSLTNNRTYFRQIAGGIAGRDLEIRGFAENQIFDQTFSAVSTDRRTESLTRIQRVPSQASGVSAVWKGNFERHNPRVSGEFRETRGFSDELIFASGRITSLVGAGGRQRFMGFGASDLWRPNDRVSFGFGGRVDRWTNARAMTSTTVTATSATSTTRFADRSETTFSPRAAILLQANKSLSFFGSYSRSFRAPTLNELYRAFRVGNVLTLANDGLKSETADIFEAGGRTSAFGSRLGFRANFFYAAVANPVVSATVSVTPSLITRQRRNVGQTRSIGIEADFEFAPHRMVAISGGYLFADSIVTKGDADRVGNRVPQAARHQTTIQTVVRPTRALSFSLHARASGAQFDDDLNALKLRRYFTADAMISYRLRHVQIYLAAENLTDSRFDIGRTPALTVAAPRFLRLGLRLAL